MRRRRRQRRNSEWPKDRFGKDIPFHKRSREEKLNIIRKAEQELMDELDLTERQARYAVSRWRKDMDRMYDEYIGLIR